MKQLILLLGLLLSFGINAVAAKLPVKVNMPKRTNNGSTVDRATAQCPLQVTYDPETREIEVTGNDEDVMEIQIFDNWGYWYASAGNTPWTYQVTINYSRILYVHIYGYSGWEAVSEGIAITAQ